MGKYWLLGFSLFLSANSFAQPENQLFYDIIRHHLPNAQVGLLVQRAQDGKIVFQHQPFATFHPASNTKLITTYAALKLLGKDFQFKTNLRYAPPQKPGHIQGDVVLEYLGDPTAPMKLIKPPYRSNQLRSPSRVGCDLRCPSQMG